MRRLNPFVARQHERKLDDLRERIDELTAAGDLLEAAELIDEYLDRKELLEELRQGPDRKEP